MTRWSYGPDYLGGSRDVYLDGALVIRAALSSDAVKFVDAANAAKPTVPGVFVELELLRELEWSGHDSAGPRCPACGAFPPYHHGNDCKLFALIVAAEASK